jgi:hypothetical protein
MRYMEWAVALYWLVPILLVGGIVQYILLRARNARAVPHDPQLGRKFLLAMFLHIAILLILGGLSVSMVDWAEYAFEPVIERREAQKEAELARERGEEAPVFPAGLPPKGPREWFNEKQRTAAGLVSSGLLYACLFWPALRFLTNARRFPAAGRSFTGLRLLLSVVIVMILTTISLIGVFQKGNAGLVAGLAVVWGSSALLHGIALLASGGWHRPRGHPDDVAG